MSVALCFCSSLGRQPTRGVGLNRPKLDSGVKWAPLRVMRTWGEGRKRWGSGRVVRRWVG